MEIIYKALTASETEKHLEELSSLLRQLSGEKRPLEMEQIGRFLDPHSSTTLVAVADNKLVGIASVYFVHKATRTLAFIEDLVVDENFRGRGLGTELMHRLIDIARKRGASQCNLTSDPLRIGANNLYQKLGFVVRKTNVYRLPLE